MAQNTDRKLDAVEFLEAQHEEIRALFSQLNSSRANREETFQCLVRLLAVHETAEEMLVHPEVRRAEDGDAIVEQRLAEEQAAKMTLADLEKMGIEHPDFDTTLAKFEKAVLDHADKEEDEEFPLLYDVHDLNVIERMTAQLKIAQSIAPTHPHPHGPNGALGNMIIGPFVAIVDRVRDALRSN